MAMHTPTKNPYNGNHSNVHKIKYNGSADELLREYLYPLPEQKNNTQKSEPWMLIHWPFHNRMDDIYDILNSQDIRPKDTLDIKNYTTAARYLYPPNTINVGDFDTWGWYAVSRAMPNYISEIGRIILFDKQFLGEDYEQIYIAKKEIRRQLGSICFALCTSVGEFYTDYRVCHTPDYENLDYEYSVMRNFAIETPKKCNLSLLSRDSKEGLNRLEILDNAIKDILINANDTVFNGLLKNIGTEYREGCPTIIMLIGPSGSGKDSILEQVLNDNLAVEAKAATTRERRTIGKIEHIEKYVWMRNKLETESWDEYKLNLANEYNLIEYAEHNGHIYGLPADSLAGTLHSTKPTVIITDNDAVKKIQSYFGENANYLTVCIMPESASVLSEHISKLENADARMEDAVNLLEGSRDVANYYLINSRDEGGLNRSVSLLNLLIQGAEKWN